MTTTDQPTQPLDLDAIRARAEAATPWPWFTGARGLHPWEVCVSWDRPLIELEDTTQGRADAEFIAAARTDVPALLAEVERLRALLDPARDLSQPTPPFPLAEGDKVLLAVPATVYDVPGWDVAEDPDPSGDRWTFAFEVAGERQLLGLTQDEVTARVRKP